MDNVRCMGSEGGLMDCPLSLSHNCGHHEDAGVRCTLATYGKPVLSLLSGVIKMLGPYV